MIFISRGSLRPMICILGTLANALVNVVYCTLNLVEVGHQFCRRLGNGFEQVCGMPGTFVQRGKALITLVHQFLPVSDLCRRPFNQFCTVMGGGGRTASQVTNLFGYHGKSLCRPRLRARLQRRH